MKKTVFMVALLFCLSLALPVLASSTSITFNDVNNTTITTPSHTFRGSIATGYLPQDLSFSFTVYQGDTDTIIDQSTTARPVHITNANWGYSNGLYTNNFSFAPRFGTNTGTMTVYLEVWNGNTLIATRRLRINVLPIRLTMDQNDLTITGRSYEFTGSVRSHTRSVTATYKALDRRGNVIDQSSGTNPVRFGTWTTTSSELYNNTLAFTVDFGDYAGASRVVVEITDGQNTVTQTVSVTVQKTATPVTPQVSDFKNRGQLVSYLSQQLTIRGYGNHKNHGQALTYCQRHPDFAAITTKAQADQFLTRYVINNTTSATQSKGKKK